MINFSKSKKQIPSLEFTVSPACAKLCDYCPQTAYIKNYKSKFLNEDKVLTIKTLKGIIKNISKGTIIKWTGFTEPLDCKEFDLMANFLYENKYKQQISTTLLGNKNSQNYYLNNLNQFFENTLHLPDNKNLMKGKFNEEYRDYVEKVIRRLHAQNIKFNIALIGDDFHLSIKEKIETLVKELKIHDFLIKAKHLNTRASNIDPKKFNLIQTDKISTESKNFYCSYQRLNQGVLLPNGKVAICCNDYSMEAIIGDLKKEKLDNIYMSIEKNEKLKKKFIEGNFLPCKNCEHYSPIERKNTNSRSV